MTDKEIQHIETNLLLEAIFKRYGYDFRHYARESLNRRVANLMSKTQLKNIADMIPRILHDKEFLNDFLLNLSVTVTEMFRDPHFFLALRNKVIPHLKTYPYINIWHAGCATGEEVYSTAIILQEEGFLDRARIYATDFNNRSLEKAEEGIFPLDNIKLYTANYDKSGGKRSLADYYYAKYESAIFDKSLKKNMVFANHNLVADRVFTEAHLVICRNVLIYFNKELQDNVLALFEESLIRNGFLCLGSKESLGFSAQEPNFSIVDKPAGIYKKKLKGSMMKKSEEILD